MWRGGGEGHEIREGRKAQNKVGVLLIPLEGRLIPPQGFAELSSQLTAVPEAGQEKQVEDVFH